MLGTYISASVWVLILSKGAENTVSTESLNFWQRQENAVVEERL